MAPISGEAAARELGQHEYRVFIRVRALSAETDASWMLIDFSELARDLGLTRGEATRAVRRLIARGILLLRDRIGHARTYAMNLAFGERSAREDDVVADFLLLELLGLIPGPARIFKGVIGK